MRWKRGLNIAKIKSGQYIAIIASIILLGLFFIITSSDDKDKSNDTIEKFVFDETDYEKTLEDRLKSLIEKIDGVGTVSVMVTLEGSAIYSYAQDLSENIGSDGDVKKETNIVLSAKSSSVKEAVVSGYALPKIKGAAVVCEKKLNATLLEKVIGTVSASLGISTDKIYVTN